MKRTKFQRRFFFFLVANSLDDLKYRQTFHLIQEWVATIRLHPFTSSKLQLLGLSLFLISIVYLSLQKVEVLASELMNFGWTYVRPVAHRTTKLWLFSYQNSRKKYCQLFYWLHIYFKDSCLLKYWRCGDNYNTIKVYCFCIPRETRRCFQNHVECTRTWNSPSVEATNI